MADIEETALSSTGVSSGGSTPKHHFAYRFQVPIIENFYNSTASRAGASCLTVLLIVIGFGASNALTVTGGRAVYAFARDRGLPFSNVWAKVEKKSQIPVMAICLTVAVQMALNSIYFGTVTGFNTVVSIATLGFCKSHAKVYHQKVDAY